MKAAVAHLEPFMEKTDSAMRGTFVLATVKGDVHDIGKNLVEIILANNGYRVSQSRHQGAAGDTDRRLPRAQARRHRPVRTPGEISAADGRDGAGFRAAGVDIPLFVGGAALTRKFTATRIAPEHAGLTVYAKDAMERARSGQTASSPPRPARRWWRACAPSRRHWRRRPARRLAPRPRTSSRPARVPGARRAARAARLEPHVLRDVPLAHLYPYLNVQMLYGSTWDCAARLATARGR